MKRLSKFFKSYQPYKRGTTSYKKASYSQCGEDLIINFIFEQLGIKQPSYLDIGAHHPQYLSNTYLFYERGCRGVNVEPDPYLYKEFIKARSEDTNLNVGIGFKDEEENADFYIMSSRVLNTFSSDEAHKVQGYGTCKIESTIQVPLIQVNRIIKENFSSKTLNFVSLDVEGLDYEIVKKFDFQLYKPEVFCIETLTYTEDKTEKKIYNIIDYLTKNGYFVYADTYINSILVNTNIWRKR